MSVFKSSGEDLSREARALVEGEDFYREGAYVVFTAAYHLRRGRCCESGCRHCPYRDTSESASVVEKEKKDEASL
jgi:2-iminoacetate synthase ThiH